MEILFYPEPVLTRRAGPASGTPRERLAELAEGMLQAMKEASGVGLAGPQVGESLRIFVASESGDPEDSMVCIDPDVQPFGPVVEMEEGCLSVPGVRAVIARPEGVRMTWRDLAGGEHTGEFHELLARILQHEFDHLEGILFFERMSPADRIRVRPDLRALEEQYRPR